MLAGPHNNVLLLLTKTHENSMLVKRLATACIAVFLGVFVDCLTLRSLKCFQQSEKNANIILFSLISILNITLGQALLSQTRTYSMKISPVILLHKII